MPTFFTVVNCFVNTGTRHRFKGYSFTEKSPTYRKMKGNYKGAVERKINYLVIEDVYVIMLQHILYCVIVQ